MDVGHEELFNPDRGSGVKSWPSLFGRLSVVFDQCLKKRLLKVVEKAASRICLKLKEWRAGHDAVRYWLYQGRVLGRLAVVFGCGCQNRCIEEGVLSKKVSTWANEKGTISLISHSDLQQTISI